MSRRLLRQQLHDFVEVCAGAVTICVLIPLIGVKRSLLFAPFKRSRTLRRWVEDLEGQS